MSLRILPVGTGFFFSNHFLANLHASCQHVEISHLMAVKEFFQILVDEIVKVFIVVN